MPLSTRNPAMVGVCLRVSSTLSPLRRSELFDDPLNLIDRAGLDVPANGVDVFVRTAVVVAARIRARDYELIRELMVQVRVLAGSVEIDISSAAIARANEVGVSGEAGTVLTVKVPVRLTRSGMAMRLIQGGRAIAAGEDKPMIRLLAKARSCRLELRTGELNLTALAEREKITGSYLTRLLRLAFLSQAHVDAILGGRQAANLNVRVLPKAEIAADWRGQSLTPGSS